MDNDYFSYLTSPTNDDLNFFLLREGDYFDINQWDPSLTGHKISEEKMEEFVPIGRNRQPISQEITVSPGDEVTLTIPPTA